MTVICLLWIGWCFLHSLLVDMTVAGFIKQRVPNAIKYYRVCYNIFSLVTLVPLVMLTSRVEDQLLFQWNGMMVLFRILLLICSGLLFWTGARQYDLAYFLGVKQIKTGEDHLLLGDDDTFSDKGVFGITRHPWYLGGTLLIWSILPQYDEIHFCVACIVTIYFYVGALLEERKILAEFGESYRQYQKRVSMLFPWKWLFTKIGL